jgi:hypothetical protein
MLSPHQIINLAESFINEELSEKGTEGRIIMKPTIYAHEHAYGVKLFSQWLLKNNYDVIKTKEIEPLPLMERINPNVRVEVLWNKVNELINKIKL